MAHRILPVGEIFHVYNRGVDKRVIFEDSNDYQRFLVSMYLCNGSTVSRTRDVPETEWLTYERGDLLVHIGAYCLMPNHFHMVLRQIRENGISKFMQKITTAYTMYFNIRNSRSGRLFESAYKVKHENDERQLRHLLAYVHLNPTSTIPEEKEWKERGIVDVDRAISLLRNSSVTSFRGLIEEGVTVPQRSILEIGDFPDFFRIEGDGQETLREWVSMYNKSTQVGPV